MDDGTLDAVCAAPLDDGPRWVYADWLDDRGEYDYATYIRDNLRPGERNFGNEILEKQSLLELVQTHGDQWAGFSGLPLEVKFQWRRGFPETAVLPAHLFVDYDCDKCGPCSGSHRGNGTPGCPKTRHHHHDERCRSEGRCPVCKGTGTRPGLYRTLGRWPITKVLLKMETTIEGYVEWFIDDGIHDRLFRLLGQHVTPSQGRSYLSRAYVDVIRKAYVPPRLPIDWSQFPKEPEIIYLDQQRVEIIPHRPRARDTFAMENMVYREIPEYPELSVRGDITLFPYNLVGEDIILRGNDFEYGPIMLASVTADDPEPGKWGITGTARFRQGRSTPVYTPENPMGVHRNS